MTDDQSSQMNPRTNTRFSKERYDDEFDQIFIRDQGPGIPEYAKDKIFKDFMRG